MINVVRHPVGIRGNLLPLLRLTHRGIPVGLPWQRCRVRGPLLQLLEEHVEALIVVQALNEPGLMKPSVHSAEQPPERGHIAREPLYIHCPAMFQVSLLLLLLLDLLLQVGDALLVLSRNR